MTNEPNPYEPSETRESKEQKSSRFMWNVLTAIPSGLFLCLYSGWFRMQKVVIVTLASGSPEREKQIRHESSADFSFHFGIALVPFGFGCLAFLFIRKKFRVQVCRFPTAFSLSVGTLG